MTMLKLSNMNVRVISTVIILFQIIALVSVILVDNIYFDMGVISLQALVIYLQIVNYGKNQRDNQ